MKKLIVLFVVIAISASGVTAQVTGGAKVGLNLANFSGDDADGSDIRPSVHIGAYLNHPISETFSFQPELLYNSVGAKESIDDPDIGELDATMKLSYLSMPLMFIYSTGSINFQAGPQLGFLVGAKAKIEAMGESVEVDVKSEFKDIDLGLNFGLGGNFGKANLALRYYLGLSNIADAEDADLKNSVISLSLGVRLFGE
ncbi:MAG TPA: porin family protein [Ohtaekwangia sp.]